MKKLFNTVLFASIFLLAIPVQAAGPAYILKPAPFCGIGFTTLPCPVTEAWNRTVKKRIGRFSPNAANYCNGQSNYLWKIGVAKGGFGLTAADKKDQAKLINATGGRWRWGCCYSSDPNGTICLD